MTNEQRIRELELRVSIERELADQPKGVVDILASQIAKVASGRAHVFGTAVAPATKELLDELWHSPVGQDLKDVLAQKEAESATARGAADTLATIMAIKDPASRIAAARAAGLA